MDLVKMWGDLLAAPVCTIPTTYFMQGVQIFALANSNATGGDTSGGETASDDGTGSTITEVQQDESDGGGDEEREETTATVVAPNKKRRRIQRIRYSREEYKCTMCPYTCTTEKAFLKHLRGCEAKESRGCVEPRLSCPICGKDRNDEQSIIVHMQKHKDNKHFCCDLCKFRTLQLKKLIQHRRMHTGEKPHLCPFCSYRSARRDNLRSHVRRVHKKENLTCDTFTPRSMLLTPSKNKDTIVETQQE